MLAMQAGGIAALITGVIVVARAPALSALRGLPHPHVPHPHGRPHLHVISRVNGHVDAGEATRASAGKPRGNDDPEAVDKGDSGRAS
jgi:hypothetical protein